MSSRRLHRRRASRRLTMGTFHLKFVEQDLGSRMADELVFKDEAAAEYDRAFAHVTAHFMPFLLRVARVAPGMGFRRRGRSPPAAPTATSWPLMSRRPWPGRSVRVLAKRRMLQSMSRMGRRFRLRIP